MVPESHGGQPRENDRLGGREAPSGTTGPEAHHELEALVLEARLFQDPIVTFLGDILHEGAHGVSEIDTGANVPETAKAPVDAREVGLQSEDLRCLAGARLEENRRLERIDMRGHGHHDGSGSAIDRATWIASVIEIGIVKETELGTGSAILIGETRANSRLYRRSRSPFARDRRRERTPPPGKTTPIAARGAPYRPRSRSPNRRDDRFQPFKRHSPVRELGPSSTIPSRPASERADSQSQSQSAKTRSPLTLEGSPPHTAAATPSIAAKDAQRPNTYDPASAPSKSPPRGPAALRAPPSGPAAARGPSSAATMPAPQTQKNPQTPSTAPHRSDTTSPTNPPSGPRGYVPLSRGSSFSSRGGRGGWNQAPPRHMSGSAASATPSGPSNIPTGPRAASSNGAGTGASPAQRPFNPPTGPSAQHGNGPRHSLAQSLLATMPPLVPGGKTDPSMTPLLLGVTKEIEPHYRKLRDEEEKLREELRLKQERLRRSMCAWNRLERDAHAWEMRSDLSEKSMKNLAGEGIGGAAF
ncbi:hypothetical protein CFAM422_011984 [Trichoderma lentiforme]|uniref:Serine/arginine repetitive matrix protein 1 n=1 Tax=Trichoderma lentiforme TaxID=1567552 RepID=A0A9P4X5X4_9HYPO|nr:hypothetical protein CFAM422_011984 [Trichoderma lentiforme]